MMPTKTEIKMCEVCGQRPGALNSHYVFSTPTSEPPDLGDWVCQQCEEQMESEQHEMSEFLYEYGNEI